MDICQITDCKDKAGVSCSCDKRVKVCAVHYSSVHAYLEGTHSPIFIHGENQRTEKQAFNGDRSKVQTNRMAFNAHKNNLQLINTIVLRAGEMASILQKRVDDLVGEITQRNKVIYDTAAKDEFSEVEMKLVGANLDGFSELLKDYLKVVENQRKTSTGDERSFDRTSYPSDKYEQERIRQSKSEIIERASRKSSNPVESYSTIDPRGLPPFRKTSSDAPGRKDSDNSSNNPEEYKSSTPSSVPQPKPNVNRGSIRGNHSPSSRCSDASHTKDFSNTDRVSIDICLRCKANKPVTSRKCSHKFCLTCILFDCGFCANRGKTIKCDTCYNTSTENTVLLCKHVQCLGCISSNAECKKCFVHACEKCTEMCPRLIQKECGHKLCVDCFEIERPSGICDLCTRTVCGMCKEKNHVKVKFSCGHNGCRFCFVAGLPCFNCVFNANKKILERGEPRDCFKCSRKQPCKQLICGDFVCLDCLKEVDLVKFNYYCSSCCFNKEKICIDCEKPCGWKIEGRKFMRKICCDSDFCRICLKKKGFLGIGGCKC